jgi:uncharacterized protein YcbK (DUF882 family)
MRALSALSLAICLATVSVAHGGPTAPAPAKPPPPAAGKGPTANAKANPPSLKAAWAPPPYTAMVKKWHEPPPLKQETGRPKLVLSSINGMGRVELTPLSDDGGFSPLDLDRVAHVLRSSDGTEHPIHPCLLDVAYALQRHFKAAEVRFLSGYRNPKKLGSNHGYGRALDLVIPGATDEDVAAFVRAKGFVGVGIYPTSGFVHVDVRDRSFFWVDRSGPGKPNKTVGIMKGEAAAADVAAKKAGHAAVQAPSIGRDVEGALARLAKAVPPPLASDESDADDEH